MDSYNLFGDDGSGMLEGLTDLGGADGFSSGSATAVAGENKDSAENSYRQQYNQGNVPQEGSIQKLPPFAGSSGGSITGGAQATAATGAAGGEYHEYGGYGPGPRVPPAPHGAVHPPHHMHPQHQYRGYHPGPDPMYGMTEHQAGMSEMGGWSTAAGGNRYAAMTPAYRHPQYEHSQKIHQYQQQGSNIGLQGQNTPYLPRQPHFSQPPSQQVYGQQNYGNYGNMHTPRMPQHTYHQQLEPHQYHVQQPHAAMPQHQPMTGIQGHGTVHGLHHAGSTTMHHVARQQAPAQMYPPHHAMPYPHQAQHPLDVNVTPQYKPPAAGMEASSPQYRPSFPQLSPQMSPRAQLSPRPVISPSKASPHRAPAPPTSAPFTQNTLQALEQMVLPAGAEYPYQRNPASPAMTHMSPSQWPPNKMQQPMNALAPTDSDPNKLAAENAAPKSIEPAKIIPNVDASNLEKPLTANDRPQDMLPQFAPSPNVMKSPMRSSPLPPPSAAPSINMASSISDNLEKSKLENLASENITENVQKPKDDILNDNTANPANEMQQTPSQESMEKEQIVGQGIIPPSSKAVTNIGAPVTREHAQSPSQMHLTSTLSQPTSINASNSNQPYLTSVSRSQTYQGAMPPSNSLPNVPPNMQNLMPQTVPNSMLPNVSTNLGNLSNNIAPQPNPNGQANLQPNHTMPHMNMNNTMSPVPPGHNAQNVAGMPTPMQGNAVTNIPSSIANVQGGGMPNVPSSMPNMPPNAVSTAPNVGMPLPAQNMHPNMPPTGPNSQGNIPNMPPSMNPNIMVIGSNTMSQPNMPIMYPASHPQERASLQQQIQEIYCLPPSNENQEKIRCLQERLVLLQQHEANDKCNGGPNCILQNPVYGSKMVESPQVTSTTGRGRKGPAKPRKPRAKKVPPATQPLDQLPVSEDCVTAGTGIQNNSELDMELSEDTTNLDSSSMSIDETKGSKVRKPRGPRKTTKERKPRTPKVKVETEQGDKPVKERRKRQPRDPNAPPRKRRTKKDAAEIVADTTTSHELDKSLDKSVNETLDKTDATNFDESNVTDFDDIPVSKIAIKDLLEEAESKREQTENDDDADYIDGTPKRRGKKRGTGGGRRGGRRAGSGGRGRKRRGTIVPESDGEPDDLVTTPPPSPPQEDDSSKRRSARNTKRKKYTDDVMIRLSDDEFQGAIAPKVDNDSLLDDLNDTKEGVKFEGTPKPNFVYVNTLEEDSMIIHHVLACRMGKREIKPEPPPPPEPPKSKNSEDSNEEGKENVKDSPEEKDAEAAINTDKGEKETQDDKSKEPDKPDCEDSRKKDDDQDTSVIDKKTENDNSEKADASKSDAEKEDAKPIIVDVEEYFVKYRNFSYLHCEWKTEEELYKGDKRIFSKIKRFKQKQQQMNIFEILDEEPFNPDYIEVERILDVSETQDPSSDTAAKHYLVKWKSLQYEDSTWELEEDIDVDKIRQYRMFNDIPPKETWKYKRRPPPDQWVQLKESPLYKGGNTLRPYQLEGLNWLLFSWHNNRNCILADEMGLGKTIQSLTFVNSVWEYGIRGPFLIIAPLSTIPNWQREFESWTDMNVIVYHGSQQSKSMIQEYEFYFKNDKHEPIKEITKFNVLITTFEIIVTDFQELKSFNWRICVIDEAHRLKNRNCKLLEGLRQLNLEHRVLLSGTPLQNNVNELFSLLNFLEPTQFSSSDAFLSDFGQLKTEDEVLKLQALLKPMMLRRLKEDVEKSLAPKEETIIEVELTNIQKKYYRAILERNFSFLQKGTASAANIPNLMNTMMELRKCCIHPYLLNGAEDQIQYDYKQQHGEDKQAYYKALIQSSGKMVLVDKLLPKLKAGGHRVLIFSQMVKCLDILEDYLMYRKYPFERIDGRIRGNLRQEAIDRFSKPDSDRFVFLLCTKAGGLGINLTAADTVIIYDSDWNPQNDLQAQARCHRIGQQKMVKIYRLVCRNSYEKEMFDKASLKLGLDKAILQSMNTSQNKEAGPKQLSKKEIEDLLKKGAYGAVMDEDNAGDKFCEEDIEMILARRTQVIQMESEKGSTFSKASFAATDQRSDIDIRDPDFWNKWAKKAEIDTTEKKEDEDLIVTEPRKRTVIKRYGHDDGNVEISDEGTPDSEEDEEGISLRSKRKKDKLGKKRKSDDYIPRHEGVPMDEEVVYGSWTRSECFKIERGLLTFGWARWDEILDKNQFRGGWTIPVIEDCARIIILFCLRHYKGDEKIRNFIWDLIEPCENGEVTISRNHSGLHNPVPRGRNAKKKNKVRDVPKQSDNKWEDPNHWCSQEKYDCEAYLESSYKKHLFRHANKVLLRVRMMYYIKHEVIGDFAAQIESGAHASSLGMRVPRGVDSAPPRLWWDSECDVSLLVGTYVHGYENYLAMRSDPRLAFVDKLGPPDDAECTDIKSEERKTASGGGDEECTDDVSSGAGATSPAASPRASPRPHDDDTDGGGQWPSMQDLNTRLRRLITAYQRNYKREELKIQQKAKMERRERMEQLARDEAAQWRWTRADEEAFRRTVASYGVEFDPATKSLRWNRFRTLARLDNKSDDALTDYLKAFMAMCKRQCGLSVGEAELPTRADLKAESIGEERAIATLERIDLLRVLREEVVPHALLEARLALCEREGAPPWWLPATHDKLLVAAVCKHGLGDTYHKIFCDPKLPFAECAMKYYSKNKKVAKSETRKVSDDEGEKETTNERTLRSRKRTSNVDRDDDTDALSELENLAKMGRIEETVSPDYWFTERALETRLHHIAHAVQNCEWPGGADNKRSESDERRASKRHIAIDVETERAKLHALLASPAHQHHAARDDASSDSGSRRSTPAPAPPPAHQRVSASPAPAAVDLSAPLDLSEAQDFSTHRRTPQPAHQNQASQPAPSRLDDTLNKIMKRNNVPPPEPIAGKEKKRKKLDEIVLGLSAAKRAPAPAPAPAAPPPASPRTPVLPDVTVTPAVSNVPSSTPTQKPFSVTVSNVSAPHKELSSFLQQSLEQKPRSSPSSSSAAPPKYSHEAKVNKWLAEQRRPTPRLAPDEPVPVVHRVSGKRLDGHKAPQLKHLAQWITENPMYDIDPKWTESIKEHVKLPQDARSPRPQSSQSSQHEPRKKGRPPTLDSAASAAHLSQSMAGLNPALLASLSAFDPKTLAATLSSLSGFDPKLLNSIDPKLLASLDPKLLSSFDPKLLASFDPKMMSSFDPKMLASLSSFDSKNNPLLGSFGGMPNLLGNLSGGNLFANLAGLGLPGFPGLDMSSLGGASSSADKSKSRKSTESGSGSSSKSSSQFPFVFPNPNMLYPQLGMGGLGAFGMPGSLGSAYDALGLLGSMPGASRSTKSSTPSSTSRAPAATVTSAGASRSSSQQKSSTSHLSQMMPNPYLLESLAKQTNYEALLKSDKRLREGDSSEDLSKEKSKASSSHVSAEFAAIQEKLLKGDKKDIDISKMLLEQMASGALSASLVSADSKRPRDDRDVYDFSKASADYATARAMTADPVALTHKRSHDEMVGEPQNLSVMSSDMHPPKKMKDTNSIESSTKVEAPRDHSHSADMDLEDLIAPSTVIKTGMKSSDFDPNVPRRTPTQSPAPTAQPPPQDKPQPRRSFDESSHANGSEMDTNIEHPNFGESKDVNAEDDIGPEDMSSDGSKAAKRKARKSTEENPAAGPRRELRSSGSRHPE